MKKSKFIYLTLEERNGEHEYTHKIAMPSAKEVTQKQAEGMATKYASTFYGEKGRKDDGGFYFNFDTLHVKVEKVELVTEAEFKVLEKFI